MPGPGRPSEIGTCRCEGECDVGRGDRADRGPADRVPGGRRPALSPARPRPLAAGDRDRSLRRLADLCDCSAGPRGGRAARGRRGARCREDRAARAAALSRQGAVRRRQLLRPHGRDGLSGREEGDAAAVLLLQAAAQRGGRPRRHGGDAARHHEIRLGDRACRRDRQDRALCDGGASARPRGGLHGRDRHVGARLQPGARPVLQVRLGRR